jgi:hypothetical protein
MLTHAFSLSSQALDKGDLRCCVQKLYDVRQDESTQYLQTLIDGELEDVNA